MSANTIIHISFGRWQNILSRGWRFAEHGPRLKDVLGETGSDFIAELRGAVEYHVLGDEEDFCRYCGARQTSAEVNDPAELEEYKQRLKAAA